jgi:PAS domain-containing protein
MRGDQLELFAPAAVATDFVRGMPVDRSGTTRYVHIIRALDDPERSPRPVGGRLDRFPHRTLAGIPVDQCAEMILRLLADGSPRTFNAIAVELFDYTADMALGSPLDRALWRLVAESRLEHTLTAPIRFHAVLDHP